MEGWASAAGVPALLQGSGAGGLWSRCCGPCPGRQQENKEGLWIVKGSLFCTHPGSSPDPISFFTQE